MDSIADFLTIIRNGYLAHKQEVRAPYSKVKEAIGTVMVETGYVAGVRAEAAGENKKDVVVTLSYRSGKAVLDHIKRISKSGRRIYKDKKGLPYVLSGQGIAIISTSKGIMTANQARKQGLGGEVIAELW